MQVSTNTNRFELPSGTDPANYALQLRRVAEQIEDTLNDLDSWASHLAGSSTEVGAPAIMRERSSSQLMRGTSIDNAILWTTSLYDNTGSNQGSNNELILPDQDQRYWWWIGLNVLADPIQANGRYRMRLFVQDYDAASGQVAQSSRSYKQYMLPVTGTGNQFMMFDGLFRSGGGRVRATFAHNNTGNVSINLLSTSSIWAVRVGPAR